ncbi:MAG TPA: hypothetical protein PLA03_03990 [Acidobacteriota bacterium]|nr:hypothetical protein [Acidobacteriota bacterium]
MTRGFCPSALGLMDNAQNIAIARDFRKCEKYLTLPLRGGEDGNWFSGHEGLLP